MSTHDYAHEALTDKIIGVYYSVYNELGFGFLESVYLKAMSLALHQSGLRVECEVSVPVHFRGEILGEFRADLLVEGVVFLELKCARTIDPSHEAQLLNYLRATNVEIGLLFNFGHKPQFRRLAYSNARKRLS